jgi:DNA processing protein
VLDAVPVSRPAPSDSIARTAGLGLVEVRSALNSLLRRELVVQTPRGWRLADGADQG